MKTPILLMIVFFLSQKNSYGLFVKGIAPRIAPSMTDGSRRFTGTQKRKLSVEPSTSSASSKGFIRVVTDIDDTVKSSGGVKLFGIPLGGIDKQYSRGDFYPGAFQFYYELSSHNQKYSDFIPRVAVLTARAKELLFALALKPTDKLCMAFQRIGLANGSPNWGIAHEHVYYGSIVEWIFQDRKGIRKFDNFEIMLDNESGNGLTPSYIFVGDTGEKDEEAGERIIEKHGRSIKALFLHSVSDSRDRSRLTIPSDREFKGVPIYYFRTYVGAAGKACQSGLISLAGLNRIINTAREELAIKDNTKMKPTVVLKGSYPFNNAIAASRRLEIENDILLALEINSKASVQGRQRTSAEVVLKGQR